MKFLRWSLVFILPLVLLAFSTTTSYAQSADVATSVDSAFGQIRVRKTNIAEVDSTHLRVSVDTSITPSRKVTLQNLRLVSLRLNGLPVYAEPLLQPIDLDKGKEVALPAMYVTVQFRDLNTVQPIREMIEKQTVHVQGQAIAAVKMSFLERLALYTEHPQVALTISQDVPVDFGSPLERQVALGALTVIEFGLEHTASTRKNLPVFGSPWLRELEAQATTNLLEVESSYALKEHDTTYPVSQDQLGFRLSSGQVIATAEAKSPWEYDAEFQDRIKSGDTKLVKNSYELLLFSPADRSAAGIASTLSLSHKDFTLSERGNADKDSLILQKDGQDGLAKITVRRRASPDALSVITLQAVPPAGGFAIAPAAIVQQDRWEKVAVFRLISNSATGKDSIEAVQISARRDGKAIRFDQPVDSSFFGSPILVPEGVIGIVQDEQAGAFLPADLLSAEQR